MCVKPCAHDQTWSSIGNWFVCLWLGYLALSTLFSYILLKLNSNVTNSNGFNLLSIPLPRTLPVLIKANSLSFLAQGNVWTHARQAVFGFKGSSHHRLDQAVPHYQISVHVCTTAAYTKHIRWYNNHYLPILYRTPATFSTGNRESIPVATYDLWHQHISQRESISFATCDLWHESLRL